MIVYDITNRDSYEGIQTWINNFLECAEGDEEFQAPIILVGNKIDLGKNGKR